MNWKWLALTAALAGIVHAQSTIRMNDFTNTDLYSTGPLDGQQSWTTSGGGGIDITAGIGALLSGYEIAANSASGPTSTAQQSIPHIASCTAVFEDISSGTQNSPVFGAAIFSGPSATAPLISGVLQKNQDNYRLQLRSDWGNQATSLGWVNSSPISASELGITFGSDTVSDKLTVSLTLIAGADANSWDATVKLYNETTGTLLLDWTPSSGNLEFASLGTTLYGGFVGGQSDTHSQTQNRTVERVTFTSIHPTGSIGEITITPVAP